MLTTYIKRLASDEPVNYLKKIRGKIAPCLRHCKDAWEWKGMAPRILNRSTVTRKREEVTSFDSLHNSLYILYSPSSVPILCLSSGRSAILFTPMLIVVIM